MPTPVLLYTAVLSVERVLALAELYPYFALSCQGEDDDDLVHVLAKVVWQTTVPPYGRAVCIYATRHRALVVAALSITRDREPPRPDVLQAWATRAAYELLATEADLDLLDVCSARATLRSCLDPPGRFDG